MWHPDHHSGNPLSRRRLLGQAAAFAGGCAFWGLPSALGARPAEADDALEGQLLFSAYRRQEAALSGLFIADLKTGAWRKIGDGQAASGARFSPDGRAIAFQSVQERRVFICEVDGGEPRPIFDGIRPHWSPDGRQLTVCAILGDRRYEAWRIDVDGTGKSRLPIPEAEIVVDWSRDGRWLLTTFLEPAREGQASGGYTTFLRRADGTEPHPISQAGDLYTHRFLPDSREVVFNRVDVEDGRNRNSLWVVDLEGKGRRCVFRSPSDTYTVSPCPSPDGRRLAVTWYDPTRDADGTVCSVARHCEVIDRDDGNHRPLELPHPFIAPCDWR